MSGTTIIFGILVLVLIGILVVNDSKFIVNIVADLTDLISPAIAALEGV